MKGAATPGAAVLAIAALVYASLLVTLRAPGRPHATAEPPSSVWWFGYARDAVNIVGFLMFSGSFAVAGLPGPLALLAGASLTLLAYGLDFLLAAALPKRRAGLVLRALVVAIAAGAGFLREPLARGLGGLVRVMF